MIYSNSSGNSLINSKIDLYNPNFIDCLNMGVQFPMMSIYSSDNNLLDWNNFFGIMDLY